MSNKLAQFKLEHEQSGADCHYTALYTFTPATGKPERTERLRIRLRADSYQFQSFAVIEVWAHDAQEWREVGHILYSKMQSKRELDGRDWKIGNIAPDVTELLKQALIVLQP